MFAYDAVKAAHYTVTNLSPLKDAKGKPMNVNLDTFIFSKGSPASFVAKEILGAIKSGRKPQSAERDGSGVPEFSIVELPYITTNTGYWWALASSMKNMEYGLQYKESQPIQLDEQHQVYTTKEIIRFRLKEILGVLRELWNSLLPVNCGNLLTV